MDRTQPKTWIKYKTGLCDSCWASCCHDMPLQVSVSDLCRLGLLSEEAAATNLDGEIRRLKKEKILKKDQPEDFVFVIAQKQNKDCLFLGADRRCKVYEQRPEICRQFPKLSPRPNHCPYLPK